MWEICVHQNNIVACALWKAINVGRAQTHFTWSSMQLNSVFINSLQLLDDILSAIWWVIIYNHNFHIKVAIEINSSMRTFLKQSVIASR